MAAEVSNKSAWTLQVEIQMLIPRSGYFQATWDSCIYSSASVTINLHETVKLSSSQFSSIAFSRPITIVSIWRHVFQGMTTSFIKNKKILHSIEMTLMLFTRFRAFVPTIEYKVILSEPFGLFSNEERRKKWKSAKSPESKYRF